MITSLISGMVFGLSGGVSPGPLLILVVSQTINHGIKDGIKISIAPLISDLPIIILTWLLISQFSDISLVMGLISICGALYLAKLGWESFRLSKLKLEIGDPETGSLKKGITANLLNPSPYIFWATIGVPAMLNTWKESAAGAIIFLVTFYFFLVGSKILTACLTSKSRTFLKSSGYILINKILAVLLWVFAVYFLKNAAGYFFFIK